MREAAQKSISHRQRSHDPRKSKMMHGYVDISQVGARNMQN